MGTDNIKQLTEQAAMRLTRQIDDELEEAREAYQTALGEYIAEMLIAAAYTAVPDTPVAYDSTDLRARASDLANAGSNFRAVRLRARRVETFLQSFEESPEVLDRLLREIDDDLLVREAQKELDR